MYLTDLVEEAVTVGAGNLVPHLVVDPLLGAADSTRRESLGEVRGVLGGTGDTLQLVRELENPIGAGTWGLEGEGPGAKGHARAVLPAPCQKNGNDGNECHGQSVLLNHVVDLLDHLLVKNIFFIVR